jgi:mannose-1-phosphate guanylyltransferase/mannose-1-phosphate guanylyltransferase/mannose-6-phosphate isomerase
MTQTKDITQLSGYSIGESDTRPWGGWVVLDSGQENGEDFCIKTITVIPGGVLSLQSHKGRREKWTIEQGTLEVTLDHATHILEMGQSIEIPIGTIHRGANRGPVDVIITEIQRGICREEDIIRYDDIYGRK